MKAGSSSGKRDERPKRQRKPGPWPPQIEPFVPRTDHSPNELKSWAKRTGFNPSFSGETTLNSIDERHNDETAEAPAVAGGLDLEKGLGHRGEGLIKRAEIEPILGRRRTGIEDEGIEISLVPRTNKDPENLAFKDDERRVEKEKKEKEERIEVKPVVRLIDEMSGITKERPVRANNDGLNDNGAPWEWGTGSRSSGN